MLLFLQAAEQHLPPINITVQQAAGGMPEWVKILISAGVGAIFGIAGNIAMEYAKPVIVHRQKRRSVKVQLTAEVRKAMEAILECIKYLKEAPLDTGEQRGNAWRWATAFLNGRIPLLDDRYDFYFATEKATVYEIDAGGLLAEFYKHANSFFTFIGANSFDEAKVHAEFALKAAKEFLEGKGN